MDGTGLALLLLGVALGLAAGVGLGLSFGARRGLTPESLDARDRRLLELADSRFREAGTRAAGDLALRSQAVEHVVEPVQQALARVEAQLRGIESARAASAATLAEQVRGVQHASEALRAETAALAGALRSPNARGRWGEMQLRRVVEVAGMLAHCDFEEQVALSTADGTVRPDLVVRLAGGRSVVVDAKVPLTAYLEAAEQSRPAQRQEGLRRHAQALRAHVDALAKKEYWAAVQPGPELVVLFVPGEAFLAPALEHDPALLDDAMARGVVVATPTTLLTLLRTVAFGWQQDSLAEGAREVVAAGRELHRRLGTLAARVDKLGRSLRRSVDDYNSTVGSFERSVVPAARKLSSLSPGAAAGSARPEPLDAVPRGVAADLLAPAPGGEPQLPESELLERPTGPELLEPELGVYVEARPADAEGAA
ncbi:DNA recombination protein RmuC [Motilibacter aurantiacus]|uniref:DNA recombination protein RmuC n=1 Tax=Motilibacter aurantiacus TaxID=2714955 RepID=UPI00140A87E2|nr:DNA recombination protein RmuC [Motilibacter aurantiacus]NHC45773.1 DNA recombination protein RmuC [Motilibacter aurantiacus]